MPKPENIKGKGFDKHPENINKGGRPKKLPDLDKMLASVLGSIDDDKSPAHEIIMALYRKAKLGDVRAAELLLERAYGKIKQPIEHSGSVITFTVGSEEQKKKLEEFNG
jgi:hypothetical protein